MAKRVYKDTPANRKLGRVGKEIPSKAKAPAKVVKKRVKDDDTKYDAEGRKDRSRVKSSKMVTDEKDDTPFAYSDFLNKKLPFGKDKKKGKTHVMPSGVVHTGAKHTKSSKPVSKAKPEAKPPTKVAKKKMKLKFPDLDALKGKVSEGTLKAYKKSKATKAKKEVKQERQQLIKKHNEKKGEKAIKIPPKKREVLKPVRKVVKSSAVIPPASAESEHYNKEYNKQLQKRRKLKEEIKTKVPKYLALKKKMGAGTKVDKDGKSAPPPVAKRPKRKEGETKGDYLLRVAKANPKPPKALPKKKEEKRPKPPSYKEATKPPPKPPRGVKRKPKVMKPHTPAEAEKFANAILGPEDSRSETIDQQIERKFAEHKNQKTSKSKPKKVGFTLPDKSSYIPPKVAKTTALANPPSKLPVRHVSYAQLQAGIPADEDPFEFLYDTPDEFRGKPDNRSAGDKTLISVQDTPPTPPKAPPAVKKAVPAKKRAPVKPKSSGGTGVSFLDNLLAPSKKRAVPAKKRAPVKPKSSGGTGVSFLDNLLAPSKKRAVSKKPLESVGGGYKKSPKPSGGPAITTANGFKAPPLRYYGPDRKPTITAEKEDYSGIKTDQDFYSIESAVDRETREHNKGTLEAFKAPQPSKRTAPSTRGSGTISNTKVAYNLSDGKKPLYKDRKEDLLSQTIGTGNYQIRPVRNPRYYEGSKNAKSGKDAPFLREGELIDQVSKGVKTRTKPAGDGIVPKNDAKIPPKPRQPETNKAFLKGRKIKALTASEKTAYEKVKKKNQRYTKKLLEWTTKYGNIKPKELVIPPSSAFLTKGSDRVIDKYTETGTAIRFGGEGITSIKHTSNYKPGRVKKALEFLGLKATTDPVANLALLRAEYRKQSRKYGVKGGGNAKQRERQRKVLESAAAKDERLRIIMETLHNDELLDDSQIKEKKDISLLPKKKVKLTKTAERILKRSRLIGGSNVPGVGDKAYLTYAERIQQGVEDDYAEAQSRLGGAEPKFSKEQEERERNSSAGFRSKMSQMSQGKFSIPGTRTEDVYPTPQDRIQAAELLQRAMTEKGKNVAQYQKIRQSDGEFQRRAGQQRAVEVLSRYGDERQVGVQSNQDLDKRLAKINVENYKLTNKGSSARQLTTGDTRFFSNAVDWETGQQIGVGALGGDDGLGDTTYQ